MGWVPDRVGRGEWIAGLAAIALLIVALFADWFGSGRSGFEQASFPRDLIMVLTIIGGAALPVIAGASPSPNSPVAQTALVAGVASLNTMLLVIWAVDPPSGGDRGAGLWLGLGASSVVACGAWIAMKAEEPQSAGAAGGEGRAAPRS